MTVSFKDRARRALEDSKLRHALRSGTRQVRRSRAGAFEWLEASGMDTEAMRDEAHRIKMEILDDLDTWVDRLVASVVGNGGKVYRAATAEAACDYIIDLAREKQVRSVVKSKSMVTEEIDLNVRFEDAGVEVVETDLGEYIIQIAGERPSHIVAPAIHKSREDVADLYHERFGTEPGLDAAELTAWTRRKLRSSFLEADMGVSGANFAIAETGTLVIVENEGNARLTTSLPRIHVAVTGMEKVIRSWEDLAVLLPLLPASATGQKITSYVSFLNGPRRSGETDGPEEFHLVLLDNGRSKMQADVLMREALACIRCGACLNACPVYSHVGGHAYGWVYQGPIGSVLAPMMQGEAGADQLPFASSLCGACLDACPVKIDIPSLLIRSRNRINEKVGLGHTFERWMFRLWSWMAVRPRIYRFAALLMRPAVAWFQPVPDLPERSFIAQWNTSRNSKVPPAR